MAGGEDEPLRMQTQRTGCADKLEVVAMKRMMTVMVMLSMLVLPGLVMARPGGRGMRGPNPAMMKKVMKDAGVSEAQIEKIQKLHFAAEKEVIDLRHQVEKERLDLKQMMQADKPSKAKVFAKLEKIGALQTQLKKNRVGLALEIRAIVGPEIWEKLEMMRAKHRHGRRGPGMRGEGPGMGGGGPMPPAMDEGLER